MIPFLRGVSMKTLILTALLALSFNALASENLALSECTKGNDDGRSLLGQSNSQSIVLEQPVSTQGN